MRHLYLVLLCTALVACTQNEPQSLKMRVATYNLRMDTPADSMNAWSFRKDKMKALILYHDFDIIGTQEGFLHQLQDLCEMPGYAYFGAGRDDGLSAGEHSAIIYKKDRFQILESGNFWLSETPDKPGKGWDATCCNRICSWTKFKELDTRLEFYFFNVHFDHQGVIARQESGKLMAKKIREISQKTSVICTGDFNSTPSTEQIKTMSSIMKDSYQTSKMPPYGPEGTFNTRFSNPITPNRIDYIFVCSDFEVLKYAVLTDSDNQWYPSDHLPVVTDLVLKETDYNH